MAETAMKEEKAPCLDCNGKALGITSYMRAKLSGYARPQTQAARMVMCGVCQERVIRSNGGGLGARLFRKVAEKSFCGEPRNPLRRRDEYLDGCGCHLEDKVRWKKVRCPRSLFVEEGAKDTGLRGHSTMVNDKIRIFLPGKPHVPKHAKQVIAEATSILHEVKLVKLEANGIGDLCSAACVAAGVKLNDPARYVGLGVRVHLLDWAELFKDADFVFCNETVDDDRFAWVCYPDLGKTQYEFPTHGRLGWQEHAAKTCECQFKLPKVAIPKESREWAADLGVFKEKKRVVMLAPYASYQYRTWPLHRWLELEAKLHAAGWATLVIDGPGDGSRISMFVGAKYWGQKPAHVAALIQRVDTLVGNDSGPAHLGGVLQTPTLALMGPTRGRSTFEKYGVVKWIEGDHHCAGCYWRSDGGYTDACKFGCEAMLKITTNSVFEEVARGV